MLMVGAGLSGWAGPAESGKSMRDWIETIQSVGREGEGNEKAARAWDPLSQLDSAAIPAILAGMTQGSDISRNWLRAAVESITKRSFDQKAPLPMAELGEFLLDQRGHPRARSLAFEIISEVDPNTAQSLIPGWLNDPSVDLRRMAVARLLNQAVELIEAQNPASATLLLRQALGAARDVDQIQEIATRLRDAGREVDLPTHFGFLMRWKVIGPFDNTGRLGFETAFVPETRLDLAAKRQGKSGPVQWTDFSTRDDYGMLDINQVCGALKDVTAYAYTEFISETTRPAELRLGCKNAWKIWLNGEYIFGRDEYHRNIAIDQYRFPVQLAKGPNAILVKVCQNEQIEDWTIEWQFQLRVCDSAGTAILSTDRPSPASTKGGHHE